MSATVGYVRDESLNFEGLVILDEDSGDVLEVQRSLKIDDQDVALDMATYCLVRGGRSHYGGVVGWELSDGTFTLRLDSKAALALQLPEEIKIAVTEEGARVTLDHIAGLLGIARDDQP